MAIVEVPISIPRILASVFPLKELKRFEKVLFISKDEEISELSYYYNIEK
jgi:hypothetical protein